MVSLVSTVITRSPLVVAMKLSIILNEERLVSEKAPAVKIEALRSYTNDLFHYLNRSLGTPATTSTPSSATTTTTTDDEKTPGEEEEKEEEALIRRWLVMVTSFRETQTANRLAYNAEPSRAYHLMSDEEVTDCGFLEFAQHCQKLLRSFVKARRSALFAAAFPDNLLDSCVACELKHVSERRRRETAVSRLATRMMETGILPDGGDVVSSEVLRNEFLFPALSGVPASRAAKEAAFADLRAVFVGKIPHVVGVEPFGSHRSTLDFAGSDLDAHVVLDTPEKSDAIFTPSFRPAKKETVFRDLQSRLRREGRGETEAMDVVRGEGEEEEEEEEVPANPPEEEGPNSTSSAEDPAEIEKHWNKTLTSQGRLILILADCAEESGLFDEITTAAGARVPVLRMRHKATGVQCDVSDANRLGVYNSQLLRCYAEVDPLARELMMAVKLWAKRRRVGDASLGFLSSYAWTVLAIHFLQDVPTSFGRVVLPNLQNAHYFPPTVVIPDLNGFRVAFCDNVETVTRAKQTAVYYLSSHQTTTNKEKDVLQIQRDHGPDAPLAPLAALLRGFFVYYLGGGTFQFRTHRVSICATSQTPPPKKPVAIAPWKLVIDDPFETTHDLGSKITSKRARGILQGELARAVEILSMEGEKFRDPGLSAEERARIAYTELFEPSPERHHGGLACLRCGELGHRVARCVFQPPTPESVLCFRCKQPGHIAKICPNVGGGPTAGKCFVCGQPGHIAVACPNRTDANARRNSNFANRGRRGSNEGAIRRGGDQSGPPPPVVVGRANHGGRNQAPPVRGMDRRPAAQYTEASFARQMGGGRRMMEGNLAPRPVSGGLSRGGGERGRGRGGAHLAAAAASVTMTVTMTMGYESAISLPLDRNQSKKPSPSSHRPKARPPHPAQGVPPTSQSTGNAPNPSS